MHFSHIKDGSGTKLTKVAAVAGFHVILAIGLIHSMNSRVVSIPKIPDLVTVFMPDAPKPPPPPPEPPKPMPKVAPPDVVVPKVEVEVAPPPVQEQVQATTVADPAPTTPGPTAPEAPAQPNSNPGVMHTAVLADANGCVKPEYPARAARNGESGTVTLALLVGTDGKVAGSRVQKSSGSHDLDKAAIAALSMCTFKPATNGGVAEQAWAQIAYVWTLDQ